MTDSVSYLTAAELAAMMHDIRAIYTRYADRATKEKAPVRSPPRPHLGTRAPAPSNSVR